MIKTVLGIILIFSTCFGCQLLSEDNKTFDYDLYNSSFGIFDFGFLSEITEVLMLCSL